MKPLRLELQGFTAFREKVVVDFKNRRLFAITGPTGAGKSSLLDAITWALYGQVARVGTSTRQLISHGSTSMQVRFDFATNNETYRVVRKAPATAGTRLEQMRADGNWRSLADRSREVTSEIETLLGMDFKTFTRTMLLPQGEFDTFLKGDQSDRRSILTKLLHLGVYDDARKIANQRAKAAQERATTIEAQLEQLDLASPQRIDELEIEHEEVKRHLSSLTKRRDALKTLEALVHADHDSSRVELEAAKTAESTSELLTKADQSCGEELNKNIEAKRNFDELENERATLDYDAASHQKLLSQIEQLKLRKTAEKELAENQSTLERVTNAHNALVASAANAAQQASSASQNEVAANDALLSSTEQLGKIVTGISHLFSDIENQIKQSDLKERTAKEQYDAIEKRINSLEAANEELSKSLAAQNAAVSVFEQARRDATSAEKLLTDTNSRVESAEISLAETRQIDQATMIRSELTQGDLCPICGNSITNLSSEKDDGAVEKAKLALEKARQSLKQAKSELTRAQTELGASAARVENAADDLTNAEARLSTIDNKLDCLGTSRDTIRDELELCRMDYAIAEKRQINTANITSELKSNLENLRILLASVPDEIKPLESSEPIENIEILADNIEHWRLLRKEDMSARKIRQQADAEHAKFKQNIAAAEARCEAATEAARQAKRRLASYENTLSSSEEETLNEALVVTEQTLTRANIMDQEIITARSKIAETTATLRVAEQERIKLAEVAENAIKQHEVARTKATTDSAALTDAWSELIGTAVENKSESLQELVLKLEAERDEVAINAGSLSQQITQAKHETVEAKRMNDEIISNRSKSSLNSAMERELRGDRFVGYIQREAMQVLAADASYQLKRFTAGRFELVSDENEFVVIDRLNGDERRSVKTLSGGETFLASLALALSLSEQLPHIAGLTGAVSLESLFLDEGFGALDTESLDLAVQGLETIASGRRMIGVVSHIEEIAERLPERIEVTKQGNSSSIRV